LERDRALRTAMGANGKDYVNRHYRWSLILGKYERLFSRLRGQSRDGQEDTPPRPAVRERERSPDRHRSDRYRGDRGRDRHRSARPRR
jgi:hypothetical protein